MLLAIAFVAASAEAGVRAELQEAPRAAGPSAPRVVTTNPYPGVAHRHVVTDEQDYHLVTLVLRTPGLRVRATGPDEAWSAVSDFAKKAGAEIAINANFFSKTASCGVTAGDSRVWEIVYAGCPLTLAFWRDGQVRIVSASAAFERVVAAVSGRPSLIRDGRPEPTLERFASVRHPRTAVGLNRDETELVILVADGRRRSALGLTGPEMTDILLAAGARNAINLDGGGSTTLFIEAEGGVQNRPSDGRERVVINHLGFDLK